MCLPTSMAVTQPARVGLGLCSSAAARNLPLSKAAAKQMRGEKIPHGTLTACVSRAAGWARRLAVRFCSPICLCTGVSSGRGTLHASPSVCQAGTLEAGGQGRLELGESEAPGRGGRHA